MNPDRRNILRALSATALLPLLNACGSQHSRPLVVASHVWPGYELMFLARREGWLPTESLNLLETASATGSLAALADGRAGGAALTLDEVLRARADGIRLTIVLVFDISAGADVVLARQRIHTLADLAGKRIGVEKTALGALVLYKLLAAAGLPDRPSRWFRSARIAIWRPGDAGKSMPSSLTSPPPPGLRLKTQGSSTTAGICRIPFSTSLPSGRTSATRHQEALDKLVAGHFRALQHFRSNPQDAAFRLAGRMHLEAREVLDAYRGLQLPDIRTNRSLMDVNKGHLLSAARELSQVMARAGLLARPEDLANLVRTDFLPEED